MILFLGKKLSKYRWIWRVKAPITAVYKNLAKTHDIAIRKHQKGILFLSEKRLVFIPKSRFERVLTSDSSIIFHSLVEDIRLAFRTKSITCTIDQLFQRIVPVIVPFRRIERFDKPRFALGLSEELDLVFTLDNPNTNLWLLITDIERLDIDKQQLKEMSLANLWRSTVDEIVIQEDIKGKELYRLSIGDGLDASRILLRPLWNKIEGECKSSLVFCIPSRNSLYAAPSDQPNSLERLSDHLQMDWDNKVHSISPRMLVWEDGRCKPWKMNA